MQNGLASGELSMVVGLGNPGAKYARTRHNAGFIVVDELAQRWGVPGWQKKNEALYALDRDRRSLLVKPQSYMNLSGPPAQGLATFYKIPPQRILVVVDELDLPFGTLRMRAQGSAGGHNGLKSLIAVFGTGFPRLRIGIGRSHEGDAIDRVLGPFSDEELRGLPEIVDRAVAGVEIWRTEGISAAMNRVNGTNVPKL
ncbi:peptidyl-tRNA hydrolase [Vulcanimicrobium alpinum]|uniref:Peptidyl-tRNA hydrolase n=1 Tax=Vulcanimicrobium alpinum TaxID=3016050 RepID=A0AAN1XYQ5_UNVUL|nr:aminoacyl-tRNA hydrolase [Vulcanimicrobium alpinum]BDE07833.1 peptidyl-tRNA hydrolase [Vulcanimicrobium alpinum]